MLRNAATPLLLAPADMTGIPQTCNIWDFSTLIQQLAEIRGSELEGMPDGGLLPLWTSHSHRRSCPSSYAQGPSACNLVPLWSYGCYSPMLICPYPSAEDPRKDNPCYYLSSFGHYGVAEHPRNKGEQRCKGFSLNTSIYSCLGLAV